MQNATQHRLASLSDILLRSWVSSRPPSGLLTAGNCHHMLKPSDANYNIIAIRNQTFWL